MLLFSLRPWRPLLKSEGPFGVLGFRIEYVRDTWRLGNYSIRECKHIAPILRFHFS